MSVEKRIEDQPSLKDEVKRVAKTTKEELMYYLSPVYSEKQLKDLDEDQLKELREALNFGIYSDLYVINNK